jgi:hypothetical protein
MSPSSGTPLWDGHVKNDNEQFSIFDADGKGRFLYDIACPDLSDRQSRLA